jgi:uncharacterized BrkB/YihY/UPF0761 family membrane protein
MTVLVTVQGVIALVGLAVAAGGGGFTDLVVATIRRAVPGPAGEVLTAAVAQATANGSHHRYIPVLLGLAGSLVSATTAFGQIERALNRLYGIEQDRPALRKYGRAFVLALTSGSLGLLAFVCLALGRNVLTTLRVGLPGDVWNVVRWPLGLVLIAGATTLLLRACPRRCQPRLSWLAFGSGLAVGIWALATIGLGLFFRLSRSFGDTYGPLAGVVGLLFWALLTSIALLFGAAVAAQLEAVREGRPQPQDEQKVADSEPQDSPEAPSATTAPLPTAAG